MNEVIKDDLLLTSDYVNQLNQQQAQNRTMPSAIRGLGTFAEASADIGTEVAARRIGDALDLGHAAPENAADIGCALSTGVSEIGSTLAESAAEAGGALTECAAEVGGTILGGIAEFICECIAGICDGL